MPEPHEHFSHSRVTLVYTSKYNKFWTIALIVLLLGSFAYRNKTKLKDFYNQMFQNRALAKYDTPIKKCVTETQEQNKGQKILGLDYECAIQVAATFYNKERLKSLSNRRNPTTMGE